MEKWSSPPRSLYDLTFSAPKSVSVQALVGGDDRLLEAHRHAVNVALQEAERYVGEGAPGMVPTIIVRLEISS